MKRTLISIVALLLAIVSVSAKDLKGVKMFLNSKDGLFAIGDKAVVEAQVKDGEEGTYYMYVFENGATKVKENIELDTQRKVIYEHNCDRTLGVMVFLKKIKDGKKSKDSAGIGFIVDPTGFRIGHKRPADHKEFWDGELARMRACKPEVKMKEVPVDEKDAENYVAYELEVSMHEGWPVRGYVAMPRAAAKKSLPVILFFHGAGVNKVSNRSSVATAVKYAKMGGGAIAADINAHGMLNDQPQEYYDELANGVLKDYKNIAPKSKTEFYLRLMYLRDVRALDCLCELPEWDGKHVLVTGQSQGGAQSFAVAGLDSRVGAIAAIVPGSCDEGGSLVRESGWKHHFRDRNDDPMVVKYFPYYDSSFFLQFTQAKLRLEVGLIDETCSPEGMFAAFNEAVTKDKVVVPCPYRRHTIKKSSIGYKEWKKTIYADRERFINDYLEN